MYTILKNKKKLLEKKKMTMIYCRDTSILFIPTPGLLQEIPNEPMLKGQSSHAIFCGIGDLNSLRIFFASKSKYASTVSSVYGGTFIINSSVARDLQRLFRILGICYSLLLNLHVKHWFAKIGNVSEQICQFSVLDLKQARLWINVAWQKICQFDNVGICPGVQHLTKLVHVIPCMGHLRPTLTECHFVRWGELADG